MPGRRSISRTTPPEPISPQISHRPPCSTPRSSTDPVKSLAKDDDKSMDATNPNLHRVIGIDLGTTFSAVAAFDTEELSAKIITDDSFDVPADTTPSVVAFDPATRRIVVGAAAKEAMSLPGRGRETIIEIKREMGELFTEETLAKFGAKGTSFQKDDPLRVRLHGEWLRPQEVSALVLMRVKEVAERRLGGEVHDAVVTVPAYFTERQKKATEEAALLAGLHPRQLIPEPTAAAIAYGVDREDEEPRIYLVFDLGGGTFDVSIIETRENQINVLATAGDPRLGGGDFDAAVAEWLNEKLGRTAPSEDERLRTLAAAEKAKIDLSRQESTTISLGDGTEPIALDRAQFDSLIEPTLKRSLEKVDEALRMAGGGEDAPPLDVDAVLLVGGSTRIRLVRDMLMDRFGKDGDFVRADGDPDTLVARGAAILAHRFEPSEGFDLNRRPTAERPADEDDFDIRLITEHTLGVGVEEHRFSPLIPRGEKIPTQRKRTYTNQKDSQNVEIPIYQGESDVVFNNTRIGSILLDEIEPRPAGFHQFDVILTLDVNGLLEVKVHHVNVDREYEATFRQSTSIGRIDMLAESRLRLQRLRTTQADEEGPAGNEDAAATGEADAVPEFAVPPPVDATPEKGPAPGPGLAPEDVPRIDPDTVPAEYRRMVRKVIGWVSNHGAPAELSAALGDFAAAVRSNAAADALEPLADRLEDAYDSARR
ncbi:Hsp70 family protein [Actinomadura chibensis]|uniref:Hsp70 family protein n=1 Tax=Actinomadura chibensis TaxID=392828 RepID=A0A5D0NI60_9ACTN|nr:Hsp70 family protein [Actinomadura chibensis]